MARTCFPTGAAVWVPDRRHSLTTTITGTFTATEGSDVIVANGRSVLLMPGSGLVLIVGQFVFTPTDGGDVLQSGTGTTTPLCPLIA
jgi:hypothetical protein